MIILLLLIQAYVNIVEKHTSWINWKGIFTCCESLKQRSQCFQSDITDVFTEIFEKKWRISTSITHNDVIKWKQFARYWPFVRGINRSPVDYPHKGQWRGSLMFSLIWPWTNGWVNNRDASDLRRHCAHYDVTVRKWLYLWRCFSKEFHRPDSWTMSDSYQSKFISPLQM